MRKIHKTLKRQSNINIRNDIWAKGLQRNEKKGRKNFKWITFSARTPNTPTHTSLHFKKQKNPFNLQLSPTWVYSTQRFYVFPIMRWLTNGVFFFVFWFSCWNTKLKWENKKKTEPGKWCVHCAKQKEKLLSSTLNANVRCIQHQFDLFQKSGDVPNAKIFIKIRWKMGIPRCLLSFLFCFIQWN